MLSFIAASYIVEFYDRVLWFVVISSFMAASYIVELYGRVPECRVSWSRAVISSELPHAKTCCDIVCISEMF